MPFEFRDRRFLFEPPTLAVPSGTLYPFDRDFLTLWQACQRAGWQVDDWVFTFNIYGGKQKIIHLASVEGSIDGAPFLLRSGRTNDQPANADHFRHCANLSDIYMPRENNVPGLGLEVHADLSMSAYLSVDAVWNTRTAMDFFHGNKVHARMNGDTRSYIRYTPVLNSQDTDGHPTTLEFSDDLGRDYAPQFPDEPLTMNTVAVYGRVRDFIRRLTTRATLAPRHDVDIAVASMPAAEPVPKGFELRTLLNHRTVARCSGFENWRLVSYDIPQAKENPFPDRARDGFTYCLASPADPALSEVPFLKFNSDASLATIVRPKAANDIFVIDAAPADEYRAKQWEDHPKLTPEEYATFYHMAARTMVPLSQYQGNYKSPVYLIGRDLAADEFEVCHKVESLNREDRQKMADADA